MTFSEALRVLELSIPLNKADLKRAFREALLVWHPDRFAGNDSLQTKANERTRTINEAYALLSRAIAYEAKQEAEAARKAAEAAQGRQAAEATRKAPQVETMPVPEDPKDVPSTMAVMVGLVIGVGLPIIIISFSTAWPHVEDSLTVQHVRAPSSGIKPQVFDTPPVRPSNSEAVKTNPAEPLDALVQYNLGVAYATGTGVAKDDAEAVRWYRKAAKQGNADAQCSLAVSYANGVGVPQNRISAYMLYTLAAAQGNEEARVNRIVLKLSMTSTQIAEAEQLARNFRAE